MQNWMNLYPKDSEIFNNFKKGLVCLVSDGVVFPQEIQSVYKELLKEDKLLEKDNLIRNHNYRLFTKLYDNSKAIYEEFLENI